MKIVSVRELQDAHVWYACALCPHGETKPATRALVIDQGGEVCVCPDCYNLYTDLKATGYQQFHDQLRDVIPHDGLLVASFDAATNLITWDYAWADGVNVDPATLPPLELNDSGGMQSLVLLSGKPMFTNNIGGRVASGKAVYYNVGQDGEVVRGGGRSASAIIVPVRRNGQVLGLVQVTSDEGGYSRRHMETLARLVDTQLAA